jgi:hypothetical protein
MRAQGVLLTAVLLMAGLDARHSEAAAGNSGASSILLELFTSEGCSSCPPVDAWVQKVDAVQPVAGAQVIVLSEHVDYWNQGGWEDRYSSPAITDRQTAYCRALGVSDPYTPQMIVDGGAELHLSDPKQVGQILQKAAAFKQLDVRIGPVSVEAGDRPALKTRIEVDGGSQKHNADVYLAVALDHSESQVAGGENKGRHLTHIAVVQSLRKIGKLEKGKSFGQDLDVKLKPGADPMNLRLVAFVQEPGPGRILGAALQKGPFK